ncbi:hypothetical protein A3Q56_06983 [Intoshia linei]|uniref:G-protein coupled receptors family 3 profile domain-containing protein n=1 Tax=Intoshia linei TaxID=1819745 RepID=A0A177AV70_9BILA|nr:hypothetical protein A3Q56_06983 [Intoshia linei]
MYFNLKYSILWILIVSSNLLAQNKIDQETIIHTPIDINPNLTSNDDAIYVVVFSNIKEGGQPGYGCGLIDISGIQQVEAILWTFRNKLTKIDDPPIGIIIINICHNKPRAIQQMLNSFLLKVGSIKINQIFAYIGDVYDVEMNLILSSFASTIHKPFFSPTPSLISTVVKPVNISQEFSEISFSSNRLTVNFTSQLYNPFWSIHTSPSLEDDVDALANFFVDQKINYVQIIYESSSIGYSTFKQLKNRLILSKPTDSSYESICVTNSVGFSGSAESHKVVISSITANISTNRIVIIVFNQNIKKSLINHLESYEYIRNYQLYFLPSSELGRNFQLENLSSTDGSIKIVPQCLWSTYTDFVNYYKNLKPTKSNVVSNIWLQSYWQFLHKCDVIIDPLLTPNNNKCDLSIQSLDSKLLSPDILSVITAATIITTSLREIKFSKCGSNMCQDFKILIHKNLKNQIINLFKKKSLVNNVYLRYDKNGVVHMNPKEYCFYNKQIYLGEKMYTLIQTVNIKSWGYKNVVDKKINQNVPIFMSFNYTQEIFEKMYMYNSGKEYSPVESTCPSIYSCNECMYLLDANKKSVAKDESQSYQMALIIRPGYWTMVLIGLVCVALFVIVCIEIYVFVKCCMLNSYSDSETFVGDQFLILFLFLAFTSLLTVVFVPSYESCTSMRIVIGISFTLMYILMLIKLVALSHFDKYAVETPLTLLFLNTLFAVIIEILVIVFSFYIDPITAIFENVEVKYQTMCTKNFPTSLAFYSYIGFIIILNVIYSIRSYSMMTNHRESMYIGITCGFTLPIWVCWIVLSIFGISEELREATLAFGLYISAFLCLMIVIGPKVYFMFYINNSLVLGPMSAYVNQDISLHESEPSPANYEKTPDFSAKPYYRSPDKNSQTMPSICRYGDSKTDTYQQINHSSATLNPGRIKTYRQNTYKPSTIQLNGDFYTEETILRPIHSKPNNQNTRNHLSEFCENNLD